MTARIGIPSHIAQRAHTASGFVARVSTALNGTSTFLALCAAETSRQRAMDELRALGPEITRLKRMAKTEDDLARVVVRDEFEIPA